MTPQSARPDTMKLGPLRGTANVLDVVREVFPGVGDAEAGYILWHRTGWPCFWPASHRTVLGALRFQLRKYRDATARLPEGRALCELCNRRRPIGSDYYCGRCDRALHYEPAP
jgi:hypothetical protein